MRHRLPGIGFLAATLLLGQPGDTAPIPFKRLQRGVEYAALPSGYTGKLRVRDTRLHVVRVTPGRARLVVLLASRGDKKGQTAARWAQHRRLAAAINLGMFRQDHLTNVGYLRAAGHLNNPRWVGKYRSVLVLHPRGGKLPAAALLDITGSLKSFTPRLVSYRTVVQNLRLIRSAGAAGRGVWTRQQKRWSEAAVAMDREGRLLLLFCRAPFSMYRFNELLLSLPLGVRRAMHVEGGPEASLSIHAGGVNLDLAGSFETGFSPDDSNNRQWALPNVLGVLRR